MAKSSRYIDYFQRNCRQRLDHCMSQFIRRGGQPFKPKEDMVPYTISARDLHHFGNSNSHSSASEQTSTNRQKKDPLRAAITEAKNHFQSLRPNAPIPSINVISRLIAFPLFQAKMYEDICNNFTKKLPSRLESLAREMKNCFILQVNLEIFVWYPINMVGLGYGIISFVFQCSTEASQRLLSEANVKYVASFASDRFKSFKNTPWNVKLKFPVMTMKTLIFKRRTCNLQMNSFAVYSQLANE
jgi:hypothetical protein